jgi:hypothetical protein
MPEASPCHLNRTARQGRNPQGTRRQTLASLLQSASPPAGPGNRGPEGRTAAPPPHLGLAWRVGPETSLDHFGKGNQPDAPQRRAPAGRPNAGPGDGP